MRLRFGFWSAYLVLLAACASDGSRYRDTTALEKPPTLLSEKQEPVAEPAEDAEADKQPDDAAPPSSDEDREEAEAKIKKGLGDQAVSISDAPPLVLTIRQPFDSAWNLLKRAMIQSGIEVTDLEHNQGKFYVSYDADSYVSEHGSVIEKTVGLFSDDYAKQAYVLTVSPEDSVTKVTAAPGKDAEYRKRADPDADPDADGEAVGDSGASAAEKSPGDGADKLLRSLYLTLKDDLRED
jgi:uncharacterized lipoprotein